MARSIGILTARGDSPGLNAANRVAPKVVLLDCPWIESARSQGVVLGD
jgi:hypothetical protein